MRRRTKIRIALAIAAVLIPGGISVAAAWLYLERRRERLRRAEVQEELERIAMLRRCYVETRPSKRGAA